MAVTLINTFNLDDGGATHELETVGSVTAISFAGRTFLYAAALNDFGPSSFEVNADGSFTEIDVLAFSSVGQVHVAFVDGQPILLASQFTDNFFVPIIALANGFLNADAAKVDDVTTEFGGPSAFASATIGGKNIIFVAGATDDGISSFELVGNGVDIINLDSVEDADNANRQIEGVQALATATVGATTFLFAGGFDDDGVSVYSVSAAGIMLNVANVSDNATLHLNGVKALATAVVGNKTFLFTAGQNDDGVSVFEVAANGTLTNRDNVSDGDNAAFKLDLASSLTTAKIAGTTYLFVGAGNGGGADDGVSVFAVAADGSLINFANVSDGGQLQLDGVSSVTTGVVGGDTFLFVAGADANGISSFRVDVTGLTINGTAGNDLINATNAPAGQRLPSDLGDTITGGLGKDTMAGGLGDDKFNFDLTAESVKGANRDVILDFSHGQGDRIDLAGIDAKSGGGNQAFKFIGKQGFHDQKGELHFITKAGFVLVEGDINGDGRADFQIEVQGVGKLVAGDFVL
jgi:6-phosphogluconolactonase (cycloisomerase 2 family)